MIAGIVVALIFFVFLPGSNSGGVSTPTQVAEQFVSGLLDGDGEQILSVVPDKAINKMMEEQGYSSREEMAEEMSNTLQVFLFYIDMLDAQVGYTVGNPEPVDDYIMEDLQEAYGEIGLTVTDAKSVPISFTADGEETSDISSENILTVQINGRWYLDITQD